MRAWIYSGEVFAFFAVALIALGQSLGASLDLASTNVPLAKAANEYHRKIRTVAADLRELKFSSSVALNPDERIVSEYVSALIDAFQGATNVPAARPFLEVKPDMEASDLFRVLKTMPKGGCLHLHNSTAARMDWVISKGITRSNCYVFWPSDSNADRGTIRFGTPEDMAQQSDMIPAATLREQLKSRGKDLDSEIRELLQMTPGPRKTSGWPRSTECFRLIGDLSSYYPVVMESLQDTFEHLCAESAPYVEVRLASPYLKDGTQMWTHTNLIQQYVVLRDRVREKYPEFNLKLIMSAGRTTDLTTLSNMVLDIADHKKVFPDLIIGGDLIGEETGESPTADYSGMLLHASWNIPDFNLYLHDGESSWAKDDNLISAVLLEPKRIGHGFNLFRFPRLEQIVVSLDIALEICPISNQLLGFAPDLRTHPAAGYLNRGIQCVLASDDPLLFGNDGVTYDFWMAAVAWDLDLPSLKKLGRNVIKYSGMSAAEKADAFRFFEKKWGEWVLATKAEAVEFLAQKTTQ